ncbi:MAG: RNA polymerase sigma factor [Planctomycetaceae bacterium]
MSHDPQPNEPFHTTRWSIVLAAGRDATSESSSSALETLCQTYWYPLYVYIRRRTKDVHEAQDVTQAFFERLLEKKTLANADPDRGRFRAFLLTACKRFVVNEWKKEQAVKRGGGKATLSLDFEAAENRYSLEAEESLTPEILYEQQWAITLLDSVLDQLETEFVDRDKQAQFDVLKPFLTGSTAMTHAEAGAQLSMQEGAVKVAVHRMRTRYRDLIRAEIAQTVESPGQIDDEIRRLFEVLAEKRTNSL